MEQGCAAGSQRRNAAEVDALRWRSARRLPVGCGRICGRRPVRTEWYRAAAPIRRLSRTQYTATVRDLLNLHVDVGATLPADSAGGEGFDNAAETLFLSPIYAEKYLEAAKLALSYASKDARSRARFLIAAPGPGVTARGGSGHHSGRVSAAGISTSGGEGGSRFLHGPFLVGGEARRFVRGLDSLQPPRGAVVSRSFCFAWSLEIRRARRACWMTIRWHRDFRTFCGAARRTVCCWRWRRQAS